MLGDNDTIFKYIMYLDEKTCNYAISKLCPRIINKFRGPFGKNSWFPVPFNPMRPKMGMESVSPFDWKRPRLFQSSVVQKHAIQYNRYLSYEPFSLGLGVKKICAISICVS